MHEQAESWGWLWQLNDSFTTVQLHQSLQEWKCKQEKIYFFSIDTEHFEITWRKWCSAFCFHCRWMHTLKRNPLDHVVIFLKHISKFGKGKEERKKYHLTEFHTISFSPTMTCTTCWNPQAVHGSRINLHMLFNSKNNLSNWPVYMLSYWNGGKFTSILFVFL